MKAVFPLTRTHITLILSLISWLAVPALAQGAGQTPADNTTKTSPQKLIEQRRLYKQVRKSLDNGSPRQFEQHRATLADYPLYAYLEYSRISHRLALDDAAAVEAFLADYPDTWLARRLRHNWLNLLYGKGLWRQFIQYYDADIAGTQTQCHYHFARYQLGNRDAALRDGLALWVVGKSQPKACDPLFRLLISEQRIDNRIAWQRFTLAVLNHEHRLARYIERFFTSDHYRDLARKFHSLDRDPNQLGNYDLIPAKTPEVLSVIEHGIRHRADHNAPQAMKHWARYQQSHPFDDEARRRVLPALVKGLYRQGFESVAVDYFLEQTAVADENLIEWLLRQHIGKADWPTLIRLIDQLPAELRSEQKWRYWHARAQLLHGTSPETMDAARTTLRELSRFRSFYGFLASDWVNNPYQLQHSPVAISDEDVRAMAALPAMERIRELRVHGQALYARREWYDLGRQFDSRQWQTAARLAQQWQWHGQAILAMARANYWDDVDIRFPMPYRQEFEQHANVQGLPLPLVLAVARQESAFRPAVSSPAGARGLMQLMPATASDTARKHKIPLQHAGELTDPGLNIQLGTLYYKGILDRFGGNRILASAAYNAGPHRVDRWLKQSGGKLPFDAWVETIPFNETRQYVQNVLAFSIIYAHHLGVDASLLEPAERMPL